MSINRVAVGEAGSHLLIVRKRPLMPEALDTAVKTITYDSDLDAYRVRLALLGQGLGLVAGGDVATLSESGARLSALGFRWAISPRSVPRAPVMGVRGFTLEKDRLCFETATGPIVMPKGARVLAVLGDLGGRLVGKVARQASMQSARSVAEQAGLSAAEKYKTIFQGLPVVDLYILPKGFAAQQAEAVGPLRLLPGKFSPDGLGEAKTPSTVQNLDRTLRAVKGLAGWFRLETDFGLFSLPGCALESGREPAVVQRNLRALREYGRHLLAILQQGSQNASAKTHTATQTDGANRASSQAHSPGGSEVQPAAATIATAAATATAGIAALSGAAVGVVAAPLSAGNVPQASPDKADDLGPMETVEPERDEAALREVGVLPPPPAFDVQGHIVRIGAKTMRLTVGSAFLAILIVGGIVAFAISEQVQAWFWLYGVQKGIAFFLASAGCFYTAFRFLWLKRWMDNTPTSKIRSLAMGMVEIKGMTERAYNLISPITMVPCVYYRLRKYRRSRKHGQQTIGGWDLIDEYDCGPVPFYLRDETGKVTVNPEGARVSPAHTETRVYGADMGLPFGLTIGRDEKVVEEMIPEGTTAYVLGSAAPRKSEATPLARRVAEKLRLLKKDEARLKQYDVNGDGRIDEHEWDAARRGMEKEALEEALADGKAATKQEAQAVIQRPEHTRLPFVIAESSEKKLTTLYGIYSGLLFVGALVTVAVGVLLLTGTIGAEWIPVELRDTAGTRL